MWRICIFCVFYKIYIELMISTWLIHVIVDIEKKKANPTKQKRGVNGVINQFGIGILIIVEY